jgi:hypothetical protein
MSWETTAAVESYANELVLALIIILQATGNPTRIGYRGDDVLAHIVGLSRPPMTRRSGHFYHHLRGRLLRDEDRNKRANNCVGGQRGRDSSSNGPLY